MLNKQTVQHIAKLARLGLKQKEIEKMQTELAAILDYIDLLKEVDVSAVKPTSHSILIENVMREDKVVEEDPKTVLKLIAAAPDKEKGHVKVKGILQ